MQADLMCEIANVEVESEDGRTQTFEMKKLESVNGEACSLCAHPAMNSAPEFTALKSHIILSVADKEISNECGKTFNAFDVIISLFFGAICTCLLNPF